MRYRIVLAPLVVAALGCESGTPNLRPQPRVSVYRTDSASTLMLSGFSGFRDPERRLVTDQDAWIQLWTDAHAFMQPVPPAPAVDFGEDVVLLVAMGAEPSGGYAIRIDSMEVFAAGQQVHISRTVPGQSCATLSVITHPVHIVRLPRPVDLIAYREETKTLAC